MNPTNEQETFGRLSVEDQMMMDSPSNSPARKVRSKDALLAPQKRIFNFRRRAVPITASIGISRRTVRRLLYSAINSKSHLPLLSYSPLVLIFVAVQEQSEELEQRPRAGSMQQNNQNDPAGEFLKRIKMPKKIDF